jgi:hypothetical protein
LIVEEKRSKNICSLIIGISHQVILKEGLDAPEKKLFVFVLRRVLMLQKRNSLSVLRHSTFVHGCTVRTKGL